MTSDFTHENSILFIVEKRSEPYNEYDDVSIADENKMMTHERFLDFWLGQKDKKRGVEA